ncbi:response regulator transcription factor [Cnuibacter physcomitrellae]|uniref:response regulator transcription factor n=1 Tax=Cnuibacter physcomitrellae TaxID=1619308 RepID=UPI0021757841|nr:response regulator transcription factor [Cnuibacter physcomitrellae]MCS5498406.1 response regulator transcription factor [Cnuibacter physcomitrellae]
MRILIAEDHVLLRAGLERLLGDAGHEVLPSVADAEGLLRSCAEDRPDLAVVDVRMPPTFTDEGIRAAVLLRSTRPPLPVLVLSQYVEERYAAELIAGDSAGLGYLLKDRVAEVGDFLTAVETVGSGGTVLDPEVVSQIMIRSRRSRDLDALTPREREALELMAEGRSNGSIADRMHVTAGAVEKLVSAIFSKLGLPAEDSGHRRVLAVLTYLGVDARR